MTWTETLLMNLTRITLACFEPTWTMKTVVFFPWQAEVMLVRKVCFSLSWTTVSLCSLTNERRPWTHLFGQWRVWISRPCCLSETQPHIHADELRECVMRWGSTSAHCEFPLQKPAHFQESNGLKVEESPSPESVWERVCVCPFRTWGGLSLWAGRGGERSGQTGRSALLMGFNNRAGRQAAETRDTESDRVGQEAARGRLRNKSPKPVAPEEV